MSLFSREEICKDCGKAVFHKCCGNFCKCVEGHEGNAYDGSCEFKSGKKENSEFGFSSIELSNMAAEMIFQITGEHIDEKQMCEAQGDANYQIAMCYFRKINKKQ